MTSGGKSKVNHGKPWENMSLAKALPPLATTVTSIKQSHELQVWKISKTGAGVYHILTSPVVT